MIWVVDARITEGYKIEIKFNEGTDGIIDFQNIITENKKHFPKVNIITPREYIELNCGL
jgi:hypothetical protein